MATPITNNNAQDVLRGAGSPGLVSNNKTLRSEAQEQSVGVGQGAQESAASERQEAGVTVSRAAQVLNQQPSERGQGVIQSADQASQVAKGLRALFEGSSGQSLAALASNVTPDLMGLLKAS